MAVWLLSPLMLSGVSSHRQRVDDLIRHRQIDIATALRVPDHEHSLFKFDSLTVMRPASPGRAPEDFAGCPAHLAAAAAKLVQPAGCNSLCIPFICRSSVLGFDEMNLDQMFALKRIFGIPADLQRHDPAEQAHVRCWIRFQRPFGLCREISDKALLAASIGCGLQDRPLAEQLFYLARQVCVPCPHSGVFLQQIALLYWSWNQ
jgi:hypothetical protein